MRLARTRSGPTRAAAAVALAEKPVPAYGALGNFLREELGLFSMMVIRLRGSGIAPSPRRRDLTTCNPTYGAHHGQIPL